MSRASDCPSTYAIECFLLGEGAAGNLLRHVIECEACKLELAARRAVGEGYLGSPGAGATKILLVSRAEARTQAPRSRPARLAVFAAASLAIIAGGLLLRPRHEPSPALSPRSSGDFVPKGPPLLSFFIERGGAPPRPLVAERLRLGDRVQPLLSSAAPGYVALVSRSLEGEVTVLFAGSGQRAAKMPAGSRVPLDASFRIDGSPTTYTLWLYFSEQPFGLEPILAALRAGSSVAFTGSMLSYPLEVSPE
jgi:hypothetical protein